MDRVARFLIGCLLAVMGSSVLAGYAEAIPPPGWQNGTPGTFNFQRAAGNAAVYQDASGLVARTSAGVNVSGRVVQVPAAMRFASNAPLLAARAIYVNPYLAAAGLGLVGIQWWLSQSKVSWSETEQKWKVDEEYGWPIGTGLEYRPSPNASVWYTTIALAGMAYQAQLRAQYPTQNYTYSHYTTADKRLHYTYNGGNFWTTYLQRTGGCPANTWVNPQGQCMSTGINRRDISPEEFEIILPQRAPMPARVPTELPVPLPVEQPRINPDPYPSGEPSPLFVPTGNPVFDPVTQTWKQPGVRVVPSPTPYSPWRVDYQPIEVPRTDGTPMPDPIRDPFSPTAPPDAPLTTPTPSQTQTGVQTPNAPPDPNATPKDQPDPLLCDMFPDILACQKLGTAEPTPVQNQNRNLTIQKQGGFGPENGTCPPDRNIALSMMSLSLSYQPICTAATMIRPVILALAYLSAGLAFMGLGRKE